MAGTTAIALTPETSVINALIARWRSDPDSTYQTWFLWPERIKNFRSIRRGIQQVILEIKADTFGVAYRGSSLETVVKSIAEQRQIFKGADHHSSGSQNYEFPTSMRAARISWRSAIFSIPACAAILKRISYLQFTNSIGSRSRDSVPQRRT
jgi:hypothetical protein